MPGRSATTARAQAQHRTTGARIEVLEAWPPALMERLSPTERAVYVLREAFDYPHREIAEAASRRRLTADHADQYTSGRSSR